MKKLFFLSLFVLHLSAFLDFDPYCCQKEISESKLNSIGLVNSAKVYTFYENREYALLWDKQDLNDFIATTNNPKLNYLSLDYHQKDIESLILALDDTKIPQKKKILAQIDLLATDGFFSFAEDLGVGLIDADKFQSLLQEDEIDIVWEKNIKVYRYEDDLELALKTNMLKVLLHRYVPTSDAYNRLIDAYLNYEKTSFPLVDYGKLMKIGDYGYRASQLKVYLSKTGDLKNVDKDYIDFPTFDEKLKIALKKFQKRHYLKQTGELDRVTVLYARKNVDEKKELIKLNIERYKLLPRIHDKEYLEINIPEFSLKYFKDKTLIDDIFVVVGREDRPTPIFNDELEYIVLNPSWIVPQNLMRKDYIPKLLEDPNSLLEEGIHIHQKPSRYSLEINASTVNWEIYLDEKRYIPYYFIQYPGEKNVLGDMKFIFPNKYKVYLHDTNAKKLTNQKYRLFSSGCIRLSKPYKLLYILSKYTKYTGDELSELISKKKTINVSLKKNMPIYIRYFTVFIDKDLDLAFRKDFYGIDMLQLASMRK